VDSASAQHGFERAAGDAIAEFNASGAGTGAGQGTEALSVNEAGEITGNYQDANDVFHGYVRAGGKLIAFDAPGAGNIAYQGTFGSSIGAGGAVAGYYVDGGGVYHGFLRTP
jgi:hypothetical protein